MRTVFDNFLCIYTHSVGTVFFSALSISMAIVVLHGAFREPDNLFIDEAAEVSWLNALPGALFPNLKPAPYLSIVSLCRASHS